MLVGLAWYFRLGLFQFCCADSPVGRPAVVTTSCMHCAVQSTAVPMADLFSSSSCKRQGLACVLCSPFCIILLGSWLTYMYTAALCMLASAACISSCDRIDRLLPAGRYWYGVWQVDAGPPGTRPSTGSLFAARWLMQLTVTLCLHSVP